MADQPVNITPSQASVGLNLNLNPRVAKPGTLSYALNAVVAGFDGQGISYQDELGNSLYCTLPEGYQPIGKKAIIEEDLILLWLANPSTGDSEIGKITAGTYTTLINDPCIGHSISHPIHKVFYRINSVCGTEVYWTDTLNGRRYINLDNLPFKEVPDPSGCGLIKTTEVDCNKLLVQPNFSIPEISTTAVHSDGELTAGTYQFAVSYSSKLSDSYTSYYSITNPLPIQDDSKVTLEFNYTVNASINITISNIDTSGTYEYINLAVIRTVNNISSFELVGTYQIEKEEKQITYTGQKLENLTELDIFEKFPVYTNADDIYAVQGVLGWAGMTRQERISYQEIANQIHLQWQTYRLPKDGYKDPLNAEKYRGYPRDEVYPFEFVPLLKNGFQCDGFHIPARTALPYDLETISGPDVFSEEEKECTILEGGKPRWQVYNTAVKKDYAPEYNPADSCYTGPYEYGDFSYWESTEEYECGQGLPQGPIRHHKMPDERISPRFSSEEKGEYIYALGIRVNISEIIEAIKNSSLTQEQKDQIAGFKIVRGNRAGGQKSVVARGLLSNVGKTQDRDHTPYYFPNYGFNDIHSEDPFLTDVSYDDRQRYTFQSPDTSFYKPTLGNILKLESIESGQATGHIVQVKEHTKEKLFTDTLYLTALGFAGTIGLLSREIGVVDTIIDGTAIMDTYQTFVDIFQKIAPKINYAYQYNSVGNYIGSSPIDNAGNKQRRLSLAFYMEPGMVSRGDDRTINNFQRESTVYLKTDTTLPAPSEAGGIVDNSKTLGNSAAISGYYATVKRTIPNQWGQLYSYETIDTGFQWIGDINQNLQDTDRYKSVFGGDIFINRFGFKKKLPFFLDNGVGRPDEADLFYDDLFNVGQVKYWYSANIKGSDGGGILKHLSGILFGTKEHQLYQDSGDRIFYRTGKMFLFHYSIPYFFCESEVNVDLRQAFNSKEGDFYPHVGTGIPDEWLQEVNTTIHQDNTYHYNKSYSKQNKENLFTHLPKDYNQACQTYGPFLTIYSDKEDWKIYRAVSKFELPPDKGNLTSIDAITNNAVLVRYQNASQVYNAMLTINTSNPQAAYLGNDTLFTAAPPLEFSRVEGGYIGSQHKCLIQTPYGPVFTDAKRGDVFLMEGAQPRNLATPEVGNFLQQFLYTDTDNHFNGKGITGVWDTNNERLLITKLDGSKSFTLSYNFLTQSWISFHSYLPKFYVEHPTSFYSYNEGLWLHAQDITSYHNFYGSPASYILEYPISYQYQDEILHSVKSYDQVVKYNQDGSFVYTNDWFSKMILFNDQQCSGVLGLNPKPKNSLKQSISFPKYNADSKDIVYTKSNSFYNVNTFWALNNAPEPIWNPSQENLSIFRELNQGAMNYSKNSRKAPLMAKNLKIRLINENTDRRIISNFLISESQQSFK